MGSKPITHRSKSTPLKAVDASGNEVGIPEKKGAMTVNKGGYKYDVDDQVDVTPASAGSPAKPGKVTGSYDNKMSNENWKKYLANETPEQKERRYAREVKDGVREAATPATPGTEASGTRGIEASPQTTEYREADKVDTFYPWEARFARRTQRASVRDEKRRGRRAERDLNRALNRGVIDQEEYDAEIGSARRMRYGQGNIAQRQIGIDGGIEGTEGFDAITSQGYQANRRNSIRTDMDRRPQGEQQAGQLIKADGTEAMSYEEYADNGGKTKPADAMSEAKDFDLRDLGGVDTKAPMGSEAPSKPQKSSSTEMFGEKPSGPVGGKGVESDPMAGIEAPGSDLPKMNESYGENIEDVISAEADAMLTEDMQSSRSAFKMRRTHNSRMMYGESPAKMKDLSGDGKVTRKDVLIGRGVLGKDGSPAKMWGPSKKASAGKTTGAKNIDNNTPGRPVTQNVTRSAKGIVTGKLNQSSAFKMKGFGNGKK